MALASRRGVALGALGLEDLGACGQEGGASGQAGGRRRSRAGGSWGGLAAAGRREAVPTKHWTMPSSWEGARKARVGVGKGGGCGEGGNPLSHRATDIRIRHVPGCWGPPECPRGRRCEARPPPAQNPKPGARTSLPQHPPFAASPEGASPNVAMACSWSLVERGGERKAQQPRQPRYKQGLQRERSDGAIATPQPMPGSGQHSRAAAEGLNARLQRCMNVYHAREAGRRTMAHRRRLLAGTGRERRLVAAAAGAAVPCMFGRPVARVQRGWNWKIPGEFSTHNCN